MAGEWFAVLPDGDTGLAAARALRPLARDVVEHASGRPWLMGCWPDGEVTVAAVGTVRLAVFGCSPATVGSLRERLRGARSVHDMDRTVARLPGCFHLLASVAGRVRAQGTLASVRRVYHARVGGAVVAADSAHVLARLTRADWDPSWLALRLTGPTAPYPLHETTPWRGVRAVPGDRWLELAPDGRAVERRRWTAPEPAVPLAEGAPAVRDALAAAVQTRTTHGGTVSTELSGGTDSASLAFLADRGPARLVTYRTVGRDGGGNSDGRVDGSGHDAGGHDAFFADRAAGVLPRAHHRVHRPDRAAALFAGLGRDRAAGAADPDEPFAWTRTRARLAYALEAMAVEGSRVHLGGHGGDALFGTDATYLHDLVRARPRTALRHLRAHRAQARWSAPALLRALADRRTPAAEVADQARLLRAARPGPRQASFGWSPAPRLPGWVTDDGAAAAVGLLRATAIGADPGPGTRTGTGTGTGMAEHSGYAGPGSPVEALATGRAQHGVLLAARRTGASVRQANRVNAGCGPPLSAPFLDDHVLDAALSVRLEDRHAPWPRKPLLTTAMRGVVPDELLDRTSRGPSAADLRAGLGRHRAELLDLFDGSELARHGLIDDAALRRALLRPHRDDDTLYGLDATLACETWLRSLDDRAAAGPHTGGGTVPGPIPYDRPHDRPRGVRGPRTPGVPRLPRTPRAPR
ncbi:asparagine synthase-related protein [Streptomyces sp. Z26]|uniref:asparagine synthase-related protein n=1 Tax=Streptomyces sp. Z26 TaxID=2500177 RepID=UPI001404B09D|nr:asparagine synthase-related protein [Streptomyces sp. Z26]